MSRAFDFRSIHRVTRHRGALGSALILAIGGACLLSGCAAESGWPQAGEFSRISQKILTPQEQQQAVQSMSAEQKAEQDKAIKTIEQHK